jgi:uncharacterized protein (DUF1800 family)
MKALSTVHRAITGVVLGSAGALLLLAGPAHAASALKRDDLLWLQRMTFGLDSATLEQYRRQGRSHWLDAQLRTGAPSQSGEMAGAMTLPPAIQAELDQLEISHADAHQLLLQINTSNQQINALTDDAAKQAARKALNDHGNQLGYEAARRSLLLAVYSPAQLREQLVWFWANHFSVFLYKANVRWIVGDYEAQAIRPHALGNFRDLVLATLKHPAMLQYLDNAQSYVGHVNENYARELMELHILGVNAGYTQQDVQELARILTGVGINSNDNEPKLKPEWQHLYVHQGAFEFNPARHDFGKATLLGKSFDGGGMDEVEAAVDWLIAQPACARFVSHKLALYFLGAEPSPKLADKLAKSFEHSHGNIPTVLRTLFDSREFADSLGHEFKDPLHFEISAVRLAYDGKTLINTHPLMNWLGAMGEPLYGRLTPDGYPLTEASWSSSGQMGKRFEIARAISSGNAGLFDPEDGSAATSTGFPQLANPTFFTAIEPMLSAGTQTALNKAASQLEWNTYLLSSPDFNYR